jgi:hypothetical protein
MSDTAERSPSANGSRNDGRDENGRFTQGNPGGPGNPFARQVAALRSALLACITPDDILEIMAALLLKAKTGDLAAARLVLAYTVGKPAKVVDPDRCDIDEWQVLQKSVAEHAEVEKTFTRMPLSLANPLASGTLPHIADGMAEHLYERFSKPPQPQGRQRPGKPGRAAPTANGENGSAATDEPGSHGEPAPG